MRIGSSEIVAVPPMIIRRYRPRNQPKAPPKTYHRSVVIIENHDESAEDSISGVG